MRRHLLSLGLAASQRACGCCAAGAGEASTSYALGAASSASWTAGPAGHAAAASIAGSSSSPLQAFVRAYRSNRRSMKPLNTAASWLAVEPFLPPVPEEEQQRRGRYQRAPVVDTCIPPIPEVPRPDVYKRVGTITGEYRLATEKVFAVVELGGSQYKVTTDDILFVNQLHGVDVNDVISLDRVLLLGSRSQTVVGRPYVPNSCVLAAVEEHFRDGKVHVFKKHKRKRYRKYEAPRPNLTTLRVLQVRGIEPAAGDELPEPNRVPLRLLPVEPGGPAGAAGALGDGEGQEAAAAVAGA